MAALFTIIYSLLSIFIVMLYFAKTPWWAKKIWPSYTWQIDTGERVVYLSFDDGPHPVATPFVLDELSKYNAKATFFCIGKNVMAHPGIYQRVISEGHAVGNHTQNHLNGWKTDDETYINNIKQAAGYIDSRLFRPPYGRIRSSQAKKIRKQSDIIMWSVLSGDFDKGISPKKCFANVSRHAQPGSIIVFHDSEKSFPLLKDVLPETLKFFSSKGYRFDRLVAK
jgi:peptidoglycan-N-acetylglucosamine deacetylase